MKLKLVLLQTAVKRKLMQLCGVERMVKDAFIEGYSMHGDTDPNLCAQMAIGEKTMRDAINRTRCWRSVDEAWNNSDAQEMFE